MLVDIVYAALTRASAEVKESGNGMATAAYLQEMLASKPATLRVGLTLFALILLLALLAPLLENHDPYRLEGPSLAAPSAEYWLGTDSLGGDVYSMILEGTRTSLKVGSSRRSFPACWACSSAARRAFWAARRIG